MKTIEDLKIKETTRDFMLSVRSFLRDHEQLNRVIEGVEHSDRMIVQSVTALLSDFAGTPPPLGFFDLDTLLNDYFMYDAAIKFCSSWLINSLINLMIRNEVPFSDGGISIRFADLIPMLKQQSMGYRQDWETSKRGTKISMNVEGVYGVASPSSEYGYLLSAVRAW